MTLNEVIKRSIVKVNELAKKSKYPNAEAKIIIKYSNIEYFCIHKTDFKKNISDILYLTKSPITRLPAEYLLPVSYLLEDCWHSIIIFKEYNEDVFYIDEDETKILTEE